MHAWAAQLAARAAAVQETRCCWQRHAQIETETADWEKGGTHQVCLSRAGCCQRCQQGSGTEAQQLCMTGACTGAAAVTATALSQGAAGTTRPVPHHPQSALLVMLHNVQNVPIHAR